MRLPGWESRLAQCIDDARGRAFAWGVHDCATWVADVRRALTGEDAAADWRGKYSTEAGAIRAVRRRGYPGLAAWVSDLLGGPLDSPLMAQRGDIVLDGTTGALGIATSGAAAFVSPDGLVFLQMDRCAMAWRV